MKRQTGKFNIPFYSSHRIINYLNDYYDYRLRFKKTQNKTIHKITSNTNNKTDWKNTASCMEIDDDGGGFETLDEIFSANVDNFK